MGRSTVARAVADELSWEVAADATAVSVEVISGGDVLDAWVTMRPAPLQDPVRQVPFDGPPAPNRDHRKVPSVLIACMVLAPASQPSSVPTYRTEPSLLITGEAFTGAPRRKANFCVTMKEEPAVVQTNVENAIINSDIDPIVVVTHVLSCTSELRWV